MKLALLLLGVSLAYGQTAGVEGTVVSSSDGRPVKRAIVELRGIRSGRGPATETYLVQADSQGRFTIPGVVPGQYIAIPSHAGYQGKPPDRADSAYYQPIPVEAGHPPEPLQLRLTPLCTIAGRIADENSRPLANAQVYAFQYRYRDGKRTLFNVQHAASDDHGDYRLFDLPPGTYYIRASQPNHDPPIYGDVVDLGPARERLFQEIYYPAATDASQAAALDLRAGREWNGINLTLRHVFAYKIRGKIPPQPPDAPMNGRPAAQGMRLMLVAPGRFSVGYATRFTGPNRDGFEISGVPPGIYNVVARRFDGGKSVSFAMKKIEIVNDDLDGVDLSVSTAAEFSGVVHTIGTRPARPDSLTVELWPLEEGIGAIVAPVNPDGSFTLSGVQPDLYLVKVSGTGGYIESVRLGEKAAADHRLDGRGSGPLSIVYSTDTGGIAGTLSDAKGAPVANGIVAMVPDQSLPFWPDLARSAVTAVDGTFTVRGLAPGTYKLFSFADAETGAALDAEFRKPYESQGVTVEVKPGAPVSAKVTIIP